MVWLDPPRAKDKVKITLPAMKVIAGVTGVITILVSSYFLFQATRPAAPLPQTFTGDLAIVNLQLDPSQPWGKSCVVTVKDNRNQETGINTRRDVCSKAKPGEKIQVKEGNIVLDTEGGY